MNEVLPERAAELARLAATIRSGLEEAEGLIPPLKDQLNELVLLGVTCNQVEGPSVYARPAGLSNDTDDTAVVFQAVLLMPGGIGAAAWNSDEFNEYPHCSYQEQADLVRVRPNLQLRWHHARRRAKEPQGWPPDVSLQHLHEDGRKEVQP